MLEKLKNPVALLSQGILRFLSIEVWMFRRYKFLHCSFFKHRLSSCKVYIVKKHLAIARKAQKSCYRLESVEPWCPAFAKHRSLEERSLHVLFYKHRSS
jgi:hypothetical protein